MHLQKSIINLSLTAIIASCLCINSYADDATKKNHEVIVIKKNNSDGETVNLEFDSNDSGIFLHELADGESKSITSKNGEVVNISRLGKELHILKDGEKIVLPYMSEKDGKNIHILKVGDGTELDMDVDIEMDLPEGLTITSSRELDLATQDTIRSAIAKAGIQDKVSFSAGHQVISKSIFMSEDGELKDLMQKLDGDMQGADVQEFTTEDGKRVKIIKKHVISKE